jgi:ribosomal protein L37AE/L43A
MIVKSIAKYEVCPNCFGENIVPRSWEGSDDWICKDCKMSFLQF